MCLGVRGNTDLAEESGCMVGVNVEEDYPGTRCLNTANTGP